MAIIPCLKCGKKMSDEFSSCPSCGAKFRGIKRSSGWGKLLALEPLKKRLVYLICQLVIIIFYVGLIFYPSIGSEEIFMEVFFIECGAIISLILARKINQEKTKYFDIANLIVPFLLGFNSFVGFAGIVVCIINIIRSSDKEFYITFWKNYINKPLKERTNKFKSDYQESNKFYKDLYSKNKKR